MAVTRINNNQITDASTGNIYVGVNAASKLQNYTITSQKIANNLTYGSDLTVSGNLTVNGTTTTIDTVITTIEDPLIVLASNQTGTPTVDIGIIGQRGTSNNVAFVWQESSKEFVTAYTSTTESNTTITVSSYANLHTQNLTVDGTMDITGNVTSLNVTGNITGGNLNTAGQVVATGNVSGGNITTTGNVSGANVNATSGITAGTTIQATGTITGGNLSAGAGTISTTGNIDGGNLNAATGVTSTTITASGNITGGNLSAGSGIISTTGNINGANVNATSGITAGTTVIATGNVTGGNITTAGNVDGANVNATSGITAGTTVIATGNVSGGNIVTIGVVQATGNVNSSGGFSTTGNLTANNALFTNDVTVVGTFTSTSNIIANVSGTFYGDANTGNSAIYAGVPAYTPLGSNVVAQFAGNVNSYSQINFQNINNGTSASTDYIATADNGDDSNYYVDIGINSSTFNDPTNYPGFFPNDSYVHNHGGNLIINPESANTVIKFMVGGTDTSDVIGTVSTTGLSVTGTISATGNTSGGNLTTAGQVSATGNITGGNLVTPNLVSALTVTATGNVTGGNVNATSGITAGTTISATGNVSGGNLTTSGQVFANTIETLGNVLVGGNLTVQGNIQYINVDDLRVEDPIIILGTGPNGAPLTTDDGMDRGVFMEYYKTGLGNAFMGWDNSSGNMVIASSVSFASNNVVQYNAYGTLEVGNIYAQSVTSTGTITGGNLSAGSGTISTTGNVDGGNLNATSGISAGTTIVAVGNISGGNLSGTLITGTLTTAAQPNITSVGTLSSLSVTNTITGGNLSTGGYVAATGNITGGNLISNALVSATTVTATGNITGGNLSAGSGTISTTGNVDGANVNASSGITAGTTVIATGNVTGGNLTTAGQVTATGNVTGGNVTTVGNVDSSNVNATSGITAGTTISATGNVTGGNLNTAGQVIATGNVSGGNITTAGNVDGANVNATSGITAGTTVIATGNVSGGNITTAGNVDGANVNATSGITAGTTVIATGNVTGGNITTVGSVDGANLNATSNVTGANVVGTTSGKFGNIVISGDNITDTNGRVNFNSAGADVDFAVNGDTVANVFYVDAGTGTVAFGNSTTIVNAIASFNATTSVLMPVGTTGERPDPGALGMIRFNSTDDSLELYSSGGWEAVGVPSFTVIADEQFNGDGSTVEFVLSSAQTTSSCLVSINGVIQIPTIAYSVSTVGPTTKLTFTEAPQAGDIIDVREITTTTTVVAISNTGGNAVVAPNATLPQVDITGNLLPVGNAVYSLGSATNYWKSLYVGGNTIYLGNIQLKEVGGQMAFYAADGTTPATIAASSVDTTTIANGTSKVAVVASGGNIVSNVGGTTVQTISSGLVAITGDLSVTGNATLSGNILGDRIVNGTTSFEIQTPNGNANISVGATSNVAVFTTAGVTLNGNIENGGSNGTGNIGSSTTYFNTVFAKATSAQYADLAEKYVADSEYVPGTVVAFGGSKEVTVSSVDADRKVAGVVSTNPSYIMNSGLEAEFVATVALTGRVPCRVTGQISKGDMMVSAGNGLARAEVEPRVGTVIGKALEDFNGNEGVIEVVVGRF